MNAKTLSVVLHAIEAVVVLLAALGIAHFFPEHKSEALGVAMGLLSMLAKGMRVSDVIPVPDYINPPKEEP